MPPLVFNTCRHTLALAGYPCGETGSISRSPWRNGAIHPDSTVDSRAPNRTMRSERHWVCSRRSAAPPIAACNRNTEAHRTFSCYCRAVHETGAPHHARMD